MKRLGAFVALLMVGGCNFIPSNHKQSAQPRATATTAGDPLAANDGAPVAIADVEARPLMQAQVVLDRLNFAPGVIDGKPGLSTTNAIAGFQTAHALPATGDLDAATAQALMPWQRIAATRVVTIPADFAAGPFYAMPGSAADQAKMPALGYISLDEKLAARFHTTIATLQMLNPGGMPAGKADAATASASPSASAMPSTSVTPGASPLPSASPLTADAFQPQPGPPSTFHAGQQIRVPNVGNDIITAGTVSDAQWLATLVMLGVATDQPHAARIVVSKAKGTLKAYDAAGTLIAVYTATMGSAHDPLPLGQWKILGISHNPKYHFNPALFWDANKGQAKEMLPSGPNGPVGVVWIDLSKPHYGIHGTPRPETIGRAESHGCVRLTNWDAARLAQMVSPKTQVLFQAS